MLAYDAGPMYAMETNRKAFWLRILDLARSVGLVSEAFAQDLKTMAPPGSYPSLPQQVKPLQQQTLQIPCSGLAVRDTLGWDTVWAQTQQYCVQVRDINRLVYSVGE